MPKQNGLWLLRARGTALIYLVLIANHRVANHADWQAATGLSDSSLNQWAGKQVAALTNEIAGEWIFAGTNWQEAIRKQLCSTH